ncbi:hypothetical protein FJ492_04345 [Mesorhizobium sp. B2-5-4]|nr:hypothetical protein FJ492_04345 [Mesorhizobium sp. B2-5-4]
MVLIIRRSLDAFSGDKPLRFLGLIQVSRARHPDEIAVFRHPDVVGTDRVAIFVSAAVIVKDGISLACIPIVSVCIAGQNEPCQCNVS